MQPIIVAHIVSLYLDKYIEELASAYPYQPLTAIQNNYLRMSQDGSTPNIEKFARQLYVKIKELEEQEDPPFVLQHEDGTQTVHRGEEIEDNLKKEPLAKPLAPKANKPIPVVETGLTFVDVEESKKKFMDMMALALETGNPDLADPLKNSS